MRTHRPPAALATRGNVAGQAARILRAVVPVVTTGLHCGVKFGGEEVGGTRMSSPSSRRGSIAAVVTVGLPRDLARVVPVVTTGLHCGVLPTTTPRHHPPRSSPSSRRGSIAAVGAADHPPHQASSSPSSRRGSIAAAARALNTPCATCRPRRHDGAPLRPVSSASCAIWVGVVVPVVTTGLHCGRSCRSTG